MKDDQIPWDQIASYLSGEATPEDRTVVEAWLEADPKNWETLRELDLLWKAAGQIGKTSTGEDLGLNDDWKLLEARMAGSSGDSTRPGAVDRPAQRSGRHAERRHRLVTFLGAALILVAVGFLLYRSVGSGSQRNTDATTLREISARPGERATVELSDGSIVRLNVDSKLMIPSDFGTRNREVYLEGEALFRVKRDAARQFIVRSRGVKTKVYGTTFDVRAYPGDMRVDVILIEGRVAVESTDAFDTPEKILRPGQIAEVHENGSITVRTEENIDRYTAWADGRLIFVDTPLKTVAAELERWFGLDVQITDSLIADRHLTASFTDEPVDEILNIISYSLNLRFMRDGRQVTLSPDGNE